VLLLYLIGFVAGLVAGISPCVLPVLPVVLVAGATTPRAAYRPADTPDGDAAPEGDAGPEDAPGPAPAKLADLRRRYRPYAVIAGLVVSFSAFTLVGSSVLSGLGLPQDLLRNAGLAVLGAVGIGFVFPSIGHVLERPFARLARRQPTGNAGAFVLGLGLGVVFVPCAGPVLAAIAVVSAMHHVGFGTVVLTVDFALGVAVPLLVFALAGQRVAERVAAFRSRAPQARRLGGVVLLLMTALIAANLTDGLQRDVPGYTSALQRHIEGNSYATRQLASFRGRPGNAARSTPTAATTACTAGAGSLEDCGTAPDFTGITQWLNTSGNAPLTLAALRGQVVLVDFWTYSCINCQRSLPHVESWYSRYHADGFEIVGVHTPEFAFEHVVSNITDAAAQLGVRYPIAVDNGYKTWNAYQNQYWPAEYLVDATGHIRHVAFGEGEYGTTESLIRQLLVAAHPGVRLAGQTRIADRTPRAALTPESYLGYDHLQNFAGTSITPDQATLYRFPPSLPADTLAFSGTWTLRAEEATAGPAARVELAFQASHVYLVLGGTGTVGVSIGSAPPQVVEVSGIPRLYTLVQAPRLESATLVLSFSPGVEAYDFTFG